MCAPRSLLWLLPFFLLSVHFCFITIYLMGASSFALFASISFFTLSFIAALRMNLARSGSEWNKTSHNMFRAYIKAVIRLMQNYINASKFCCLNFASSYNSFQECAETIGSMCCIFIPFFSVHFTSFARISCRLIRPLLVLLLPFFTLDPCILYVCVSMRYMVYFKM